jgi:hypothetical protein
MEHPEYRPGQVERWLGRGEFRLDQAEPEELVHLKQHLAGLPTDALRQVIEDVTLELLKHDLHETPHARALGDLWDAEYQRREGGPLRLRRAGALHETPATPGAGPVPEEPDVPWAPGSLTRAALEIEAARGYPLSPVEMRMLEAAHAPPEPPPGLDADNPYVRPPWPGGLRARMLWPFYVPGTFEYWMSTGAFPLSRAKPEDLVHLKQHLAGLDTDELRRLVEQISAGLYENRQHETRHGRMLCELFRQEQARRQGQEPGATHDAATPPDLPGGGADD